MTFPATIVAVTLMTTMAPSAISALERATILDAARAPVAARLGKPVMFRVDKLTVEGDWAFLRADMQDRQGRAIDYAGTPLADAWANGAVSKSCAVLLHRRGEGWSVVASAVGPTDVAWDGWAAEHRAPASLFR